MTAPTVRVIDVHAHWFPDELVELHSRLVDPDLARATVAGAPGARLSDVEIIGQLDHAGIDKQVMSSANLIPCAARSADAAAAARSMNDLYADLVRRHPTRFGFFGAVPLPHVDLAVTEAARCLDQLGAAGIAVGATVTGRPLDDPSFAPLWAELDRRGTPVFVHPVGVGPAPRAYNLNWVVGAPFEDTLAALRLVLSGVTSRHSAIRFVVPHLGGTVPFLMTRIDRATAVVSRSADVTVDLPASRHLRRLHYDTSGRNASALRCAIDVLGTDALVLGTDFPFSVDDDLRANVTYVREVIGAAPPADAVLGGNALHMLGRTT